MLEQLKRSVTLYLPVSAAIGAVVTLIAVDLSRDFAGWWSPPVKEAETPQEPVPEVPEAPDTGTVIDEETGQQARISYTTFISLDHRGFRVVTSHNFENGETTPAQEYCYAVTKTFVGNSATQVTLATRARGEPVDHARITEPEARPFEIRAAELMAVARSHCRFTDTSDGIAPVTAGKDERDA